jgi:hypothetical protein
MRANQKRLRIRVADTPDPDVSGEVRKIFLKAGAEGGIGDGVDFSGAATVFVQHSHSRTPGSEMAVIICAEKHIQHNVAV